MCRPRCAKFVSEATNCELLDNVWRRAFTTKDRVTFGFTVGSADVNFCGTIRSKILSAGGVGRINLRSRTLPPRPRVYQPFFLGLRSLVQQPMSALGQKQTFAVQNGMSALPPKADMCGALAHVRYVPKADIDHRWRLSSAGIVN